MRYVVEVWLDDDLAPLQFSVEAYTDDERSSCVVMTGRTPEWNDSDLYASAADAVRRELGQQERLFSLSERRFNKHLR